MDRNSAALWDAIDAYVRYCGGEPIDASAHPRPTYDRLVRRIDAAARAMQKKAVVRAMDMALSSRN